METVFLPLEQVNIDGNQIRYVKKGKGKPVIFIHGIPTSSYLWRNILPKIALRHQCIALDLIGMGASDKPAISYTVEEQISYFEKFMQALELTSEVTLVMHGWGSIIGLTYAMRYAASIKNIVLLEPYLNVTESYGDVSVSVNEITRLSEGDSEKLKYYVIEENYLVEKMLPALTVKKLTEEVWNTYRQPFEEKRNRQILWQFAMEQPYRNSMSPVVKMINDYTLWLQETNLPKLILYGMPGFLMRMNSVMWAMNHLSSLTQIEVGKDFHYLPESCTERIQEELSNWLHQQAKNHAAF